MHISWFKKNYGHHTANYPIQDYIFPLTLKTITSKLQNTSKEARDARQT